MPTYAKAPNSCELNKQLNRGWVMQVKPAGAAPTEYKFVRGLTSLNVVVETSTVDTSDLDSDGWTSEMKSSRSLTITADGQYARQGDTDVLTPDLRLLRATGEELGGNGLIDARVWRADSDEGWEGTFNNSFAPSGGDANALRTFTATLKASCAPTRIHSVLEGAATAASVPLTAEELLALISPTGEVTPPTGG